MRTVVALFTYNRPNHTERTLKQLVANTVFNDLPIHIFADGSKNKQDENFHKLREIIKNFANTHHNVNLFLSKENKGLANSILFGVSKSFEEFDQIIVLEDDIVTSKYFLKYMIDALKYYRDNPKIGSISGFNFPQNVFDFPKGYTDDVFLCSRPSSWGWATWKDRWEQVDWAVGDYDKFKYDRKLQKEFNKGGDDLSNMLKAQMEGKIDSWAIRWAYHHFINKLLAVYPVLSFVDNIGSDGSGVHSKVSNEDRFRNKILNSKKDIKFIKNSEINLDIMKRFRRVFAKNIQYYLRKILIKLKTISRV